MIPLRDRNPRHGPPSVTWLLLGVNVLVFLYQAFLGHTVAGGRFVLEYAFIPALFFEQPLANLSTLVSSAFLHGGLVHLLSNMIFLLVFGDNVEDRLGHLGYLLFYLAGAAVATLLHGLTETGSLVPLVGASGAISAVLGAYIVYYPRQQVLTFIPPLLLPWLLLNFFLPMRRFFAPWLPAWLYIGYWALVQFWEAGVGLTGGAAQAQQQVAWWAHVGGFGFGAGLALLGVGRRRTSAGNGSPRRLGF